MRTARFIFAGICVCMLCGCKPVSNFVDNLKPSEKAVESPENRPPINRDLWNKINRGSRLSLEDQNRLEGAKLNNRMGEEAFVNQRFTDALNRFQLAISQVPDYVDAINNLGRTYYVMQMFDSALASYNHALDVAAVVEPDDTTTKAVIHANIGDVYRQREEYAQALEEYKKVVLLAPHSARAQYEIGNLYLKQASKRYPDDDIFHSKSWRERKLQDAIKQFDKALHMDGSLNHAFMCRAISNTMLKEYDDAWADVEELETRNFEVNQDLKNTILKGLDRARKAERFQPGI